MKTSSITLIKDLIEDPIAIMGIDEDGDKYYIKNSDANFEMALKAYYDTFTCLRNFGG